MTSEIITLPVRDTMTDDRLNLHRAAQLDECKSSGCTHDCREGRDCPQRADRDPVDWGAVALVALILAVICVAAFSPEIAAFVYKISN